jgi:hypothetical protein
LRSTPPACAETNRFLSDVRYLVGSHRRAARQAPVPLEREADGSKEAALKEWIKQGSPNLEPLLTGCAWQPCCRTPTTPPAAMPTACRAPIR